jgi:hypothetical protein
MTTVCNVVLCCEPGVRHSAHMYGLPVFCPSVLNMLVKPMKSGVTATVLMDCCHSGTVLDLPYKFAADSKQMQREEGFNMEVVPEAIRQEKPTEAELREAKRQRKKEVAAKEKAAAKKAAKAGPPDNDIVGPKLAPNGQPVLPTRPAAHKPTVDDDGKRMKDEQAPPAPPKQCCVIM